MMDTFVGCCKVILPQSSLHPIIYCHSQYFIPTYVYGNIPLHYCNAILNDLKQFLTYTYIDKILINKYNIIYIVKKSVSFLNNDCVGSEL